MSKLKLPADNGPYRGGKGMLYEGGTRVAALANWPGRIKSGELKKSSTSWICSRRWLGSREHAT